MTQKCPPAEQKRKSIELGRITVIGTREQGYRSTLATTANKTDADIQQTPFSLQTRELIEDRGVHSFSEAVRTVPGLTPQVGYGGSNTRFRLRGFAASGNLKNGFRRNAFIPADELANVEQIEALKGPASALYGRFEPGGVVNIVTKRPLAKPMQRMDFSVGRHGFRRVTYDGSDTMENGMAWRINAALEKADSFRDHVDSEVSFLSPSLRFDVGGGLLFLDAEWLRRGGAFDRGLGNNARFLQVPIRANYAGNKTNADTESDFYSLVYEKDLTEKLHLRIGAAHSRGKLDAVWWAYGFPPVLGAATPNPIVNRNLTQSQDVQTDDTVQLKLSGRWGEGWLRHHWLAELEWSRDEWDNTYYRAPNRRTPLFSPEYGIDPGQLAYDGGGRYGNRSVSLYLQDQIDLGQRWILLLGLRHDRIKMRTQSAAWLNIPERITQNRSATSPRVGLTWTPDPRASFYASWARSFRTEPDVARLRSGELARPSIGEQKEFGLKLNLLDGRFTPTAARFDLIRKDGLVSDPDDWNYSIQVGKQRARGWKFDLPLALTPNWRLVASYTRLDARFDQDPTLTGKIIANAPRDNGSIWTTYDLSGRLAGLSLGLGTHYVGERQANNANTFTLPAYTRWDANFVWRFGERRRWKAQLNIENLGNKRYYDSGGSFVPTYPGAPRTWTASLAYQFR